MRTALKRLSLAILVSLVLVQVPFVYRRIKFGELDGKIRELQRARRPESPPVDGLREFRGVIHVHTSLGGHSTGSFDELIAAADANGLDFVIMTEHWSDRVDTAKLSLNGHYGRTLFAGGNEIDTATGQDRLLVVPGLAGDGARVLGTGEITQKIRNEGRAAFVTYPDTFGSWDSPIDGIEVFSLHTNSQQASRFVAALDVLWSYGPYPDQVLMNYFSRPDANLQKFDEIAARRKVSLMGGSDAHSNIGFHLLGDYAGNKLLSFQLDDYSTIFRLLRQHVLLRPGQELSQESLVSALKEGHSFMALDALGDPAGFRFGTADGRLIMGDEAQFGETGASDLISRSPIPGRFVVYRNGEVYLQSDRTAHISFSPGTPGAYRVEVYLDELGPPYDKMPWIISNPVFLR
jgi:hypothetical protein